jgi:hypothetical protein
VSIIFGFGDTEKRFEEKLEAQMWDYVAAEFAKESEGYFTDEFVSKINGWATALGNESQRLSDEYKEAAEYPARYSRFWCYTLGDCNHIVFILSIHHINRRHALSPDGWGMMTSKRVIDVYNGDLGRSTTQRNGGE